MPADMVTNASLATVLGQPIALQSDETGTLHAGETELDSTPVYFTFEMVGVDVAAATLSELRRLDVPLDEWVAQHAASTIVVTETSALT